MPARLLPPERLLIAIALFSAGAFAGRVWSDRAAAGPLNAPAARPADAPRVIRTAPGRGPEVHAGRLLWAADGTRYGGPPAPDQVVWEVAAPGGSFAFAEE